MDTLFSVVFPSAEAAKQACDDYAKTVGFALSIRKTTWLDDGSGVKKRMLSCAKGRKYVSYADPNTHLTKRRSSATQMTCCPFRLWIKSSGSGAYIIEPGQTTDHNHPFAPKVAFPKFRKETILRYEDKIIAMYSSGSTPIQIARFIASEVSKAQEAGEVITSVITKDISNIIAQHRKSRLQGRTPIQYLYQHLNKEGFVFKDRCDPSGRLISLLIAPTAGLQLLKRSPNVLLLDCTYKTNRFNMPLLNICGVTSSNKTFTVASIFLHREVEESYSWALSVLLKIIEQYQISPPRVTVTDRELALINAIESQPALKDSVNLLCRWHINMNVLTKCKSMFPGAKRVNGVVERDPSFQAFLQDWGKLVRSRDEGTFNSRLTDFIRQHPKKPVDYCLDTWIYPWKDRFVIYLVNRHRHLGHVTTSIVESLHGQMKRFLWSSKADFDTIIDRFNEFWKHQIENIRNLQAIQIHKLSTFHLKALYLPIREQVSSYALKILKDEHRAVELKPNRDLLIGRNGCICEKAVAWGLPCRHLIHTRLFHNRTLSLDDFDPHWHREAPKPGADVPFEPLIIRGKGRPRGSLNLDKTRSNRRDPSSHEIAASLEALEARLPSSTAPAKLETPQLTGLAYIKQVGDTFEPGTQAPRKAQQARCQTPPDEEVKPSGELELLQDTEHETLTDFDIMIISQQYDVRKEEEEEEESDNWNAIDKQLQSQETQEEIICALTTSEFIG